MNRKRQACAAVVTVLLALLAGQVDASVLQKQIVASDATRLVHFDMDAFLRSRIGEHLTNNPDTFDFMADVAEMEAETGVNMLRDIHSVTVYGATDEDVVVAIAGSAALDKALQQLQQQEGYSQSQLEGYTIHLVQPQGDDDDDDTDIDDDDDLDLGADGELGAKIGVHADVEVDVDVEVDDADVDGGLHLGLGAGESICAALVAGVEPSQRMAFLAATPEHVVRGIKVYEKKLPNLADHPASSLKASPRTGSVVFVAVAGLGDLAGEIDLDSEVAGVAQRAKQITFDIGELKDSVYISGQVEAANEEDARNLGQVVQGLVALVSLMGGDDPEMAELKKLTSGLRIKNEANTISAELLINSDEMIKHLHEHADHH
jgi:hypothetical protein